MAVAALVLGILGIILFSWLGPFLGAAWATTLSVQAFTDASSSGAGAEVVTWPLWALGLLIGVGVPALAVILGGISMAKTETKGVAIGGIVTGVVGMLGGFILIFVFQAIALVSQAAVGGMTDPDQVQKQMQQLQQQLDDPMAQQQIQQQLMRAAEQLNQQLDTAAKPEPMEPVNPAEEDRAPDKDEPAPESPSPAPASQ